MVCLACECKARECAAEGEPNFTVPPWWGPTRFLAGVSEGLSAHDRASASRSRPRVQLVCHGATGRRQRWFCCWRVLLRLARPRFRARARARMPPARAGDLHADNGSATTSRSRTPAPTTSAAAQPTTREKTTRRARNASRRQPCRRRVPRCFARPQPRARAREPPTRLTTHADDGSSRMVAEATPVGPPAPFGAATTQLCGASAGGGADDGAASMRAPPAVGQLASVRAGASATGDGRRGLRPRASPLFCTAAATTAPSAHGEHVALAATDRSAVAVVERGKAADARARHVAAQQQARTARSRTRAFHCISGSATNASSRSITARTTSRSSSFTTRDGCIRYGGG